MTAAALALAVASAAGPACGRADLMPALPQKVNERALLDAACGASCLLECPADQPAGQDEEAPQQLVSHYEGSFRCPGKVESIVSLFPCGDAMGMHGIAGSVVLMRATRPPGKSTRGPRWEKVDTVENTVLGGKCQVARAGDRDVLVCLSGWGPLQGITGDSLCVLGGAGEFAMVCPLRVQDSCGSGSEGAFSATVESWSVAGPAADGTRSVHVTIKRAGCDGQHPRTLEAVVLLDAAGAHLAPETAALLKKVDVGQE